MISSPSARGRGLAFDDPFPESPPTAADGQGEQGLEEAFQRACERVLRWLVAPQVHRLNNLITQVVGRVDLVGGEAEAEKEAVREPLFALTRRLYATAAFSKRMGTAEDLEGLLEELALLLEPLADACRTRYEAFAGARSLAGLPAGLQVAAVVLVARELVAARAASQAGPGTQGIPGAGGVHRRDRRVRLRLAAGGPQRLRVWIASSVAGARSPEHERWVARLVRASLGSAPARVRWRGLGGRGAWSLELGCTLGDPLPRPLAPARILLVDPDQSSLEILADVLAEEFRVRAVADRGELEEGPQAFALVLLSGGALARDPGLLEASRNALADAERGRVALLGPPPAGSVQAPPGLSSYEGPLHPEPLLAFVRDCLPRQSP